MLKMSETTELVTEFQSTSVGKNDSCWKLSKRFRITPVRIWSGASGWIHCVKFSQNAENV